MNHHIYHLFLWPVYTTANCQITRGYGVDLFAAMLFYPAGNVYKTMWKTMVYRSYKWWVCHIYVVSLQEGNHFAVTLGLKGKQT